MTGEGSDEHGREDDPDDNSLSGLPEMTEATVLAPQQQSPRRTLRLMAPALRQTILRRIRDALPANGASTSPRRCQLLEAAVEVAVETFVVGRPGGDPDGNSRRRKADELYRRIGYLEARHDRDPADLVVSLEAARRAGWQHLSESVADHTSSRMLSHLVDNWQEHVDHIHAELLAGRSLWPGAARDSTPNRQALMSHFLDRPPGRISPRRPLGVDPEQLASLAESAEWVVPEQIVALALTFHGESPAPPKRPDLLWTVRDDRMLLICPEPDAMELAGALQRAQPGRRVAISWPVSPTEAGSALLWVDRALDLVRIGVIPPTAIVPCAEHATQIWLHAEPSMRQQLCQELLKPLLAESPNSREILSETLLAWLETRDSAPAIAARLDVHPQTVRYRWKRINELFGDGLDDPEFVIQVTLVLKASVHMWRAGHQGDFDRFHDRSRPRTEAGGGP